MQQPGWAGNHGEEIPCPCTPHCHATQFNTILLSVSEVDCVQLTIRQPADLLPALCLPTPALAASVWYNTAYYFICCLLKPYYHCVKLIAKSLVHCYHCKPPKFVHNILNNSLISSTDIRVGALHHGYPSSTATVSVTATLESYMYHS